MRHGPQRAGFLPLTIEDTPLSPSSPSPLSNFLHRKRSRLAIVATSAIVFVAVAMFLLTYDLLSSNSSTRLLDLITDGASRIGISLDKAKGSVGNAALEEILARGAPILGPLSDAQCSAAQRRTCDWMSKVPDSTKIIHMNLPGTHDSATGRSTLLMVAAAGLQCHLLTGNYSDARQAELLRYTGPIPWPAKAYRCQQRSLFQMLNDGIRVFDLRYAYNPGNDTIGFYHCMSSGTSSRISLSID